MPVQTCKKGIQRIKDYPFGIRLVNGLLKSYKQTINFVGANFFADIRSNFQMLQINTFVRYESIDIVTKRRNIVQQLICFFLKRHENTWLIVHFNSVDDVLHCHECFTTSNGSNQQSWTIEGKTPKSNIIKSLYSCRRLHQFIAFGIPILVNQFILNIAFHCFREYF